MTSTSNFWPHVLDCNTADADDLHSLRAEMISVDQAAQGDVAAGLGVPGNDEEAARHLRKVHANRASAARSKERKKVFAALEQQVPFLPVSRSTSGRPGGLSQHVGGIVLLQ